MRTSQHSRSSQRRARSLSRQVECSACNLGRICLPGTLDESTMHEIEENCVRKLQIVRGTSLYRAGAPLKSLYAIRAGFMKCRVLHESGREQITGFYMMGDVLGLDAVGTGLHLCDAVALDDAELCEIAYSTLEQLCRDVPRLQCHVQHLLGMEIAHHHAALHMLTGKRAEERVAGFLLDVSRRLAERGYSPREFELRMKREEIGSYLGLQLETVSRVLSMFHDMKCIDVRRKRIRLTDMQGLRGLAGLRGARGARN